MPACTHSTVLPRARASSGVKVPSLLATTTGSSRPSGLVPNVPTRTASVAAASRRSQAIVASRRGVSR